MDENQGVQSLLTLYSDGVSRRDWDQIVATFLPDAVWEMADTPCRFAGRDAIRTGIEALLKPTRFLVQINAPALIRIDGAEATARSTIHESGRFADRDESFDAFGSYEDRLVRTAEGWRFAQRRFHLIGLYRTPALPDAPPELTLA